MDVSVLGAKPDAQRFDNQAEVHSALTAALKPLDVALVVMEATGGYETELACALQAGATADTPGEGRCGIGQGAVCTDGLGPR